MAIIASIASTVHFCNAASNMAVTLALSESGTFGIVKSIRTP
eukprot:SAG11_NODE_1491_length_4810_cov_1.999363_8_plen_42_part_00